MKQLMLSDFLIQYQQRQYQICLLSTAFEQPQRRAKTLFRWNSAVNP